MSRACWSTGSGRSATGWAGPCWSSGDAAASGEVGIGSTVEIEDDKGDRMTLEISSVGGISPDSPLGRALLGAKLGEEVEVKAPRGSWRARISSIGGPQT